MALRRTIAILGKRYNNMYVNQQVTNSVSKCKKGVQFIKYEHTMLNKCKQRPT